MAIPPTAEAFADALDPHEELDFRIELADLLEDGEAIDAANWTLEVLAEGAALGLSVMSGDGRDPVLSESDTAVTFWLKVDPAFQDNPAFGSGGTALPLRITAQTDTAPPRKRQRTFSVRVAQQ